MLLCLCVSVLSASRFAKEYHFEGPQDSLLPRLLIVALNMKSMEHWLTNIDGKPAVLVKIIPRARRKACPIATFPHHASYMKWPLRTKVSAARGVLYIIGV